MTKQKIFFLVILISCYTISCRKDEVSPTQDSGRFIIGTINPKNGMAKFSAKVTSLTYKPGYSLKSEGFFISTVSGFSYDTLNGNRNGYEIEYYATNLRSGKKYFYKAYLHFSNSIHEEYIFSEEKYFYTDSSNTWSIIQNIDFNYHLSACFSVNKKIYLLVGTKLWEYDENSMKLISKTDFPGKSRFNGAYFSTSTKGYIGCGEDNYSLFNDFWEYNPLQNSWKSLPDFPGGKRKHTVSFSINDNGYIGLGIDTIRSYFMINKPKKDLWKYNPNTSEWFKMTDLDTSGRFAAFSFVVNNKAYIGTGSVIAQGGLASDVWEYNGESDVWSKKSDFPASSYYEYNRKGRFYALSTNIKNKGYVVSGEGSSGPIPDIWEYDPQNDTWKEKARTDYNGSFYNKSYYSLFVGLENRALIFSPIQITEFIP